MTLKTTRRFEKDYDLLPDEIKDAVDSKLSFFVINPRYPSLRIKKMEGAEGIWEMRVTDNYRITFTTEKDLIILRRVGTHDILKRP